jgi:hypothetical protein
MISAQIQHEHRSPTLTAADSGFVGGGLYSIVQKYAAIEQVSCLPHRCRWPMPYGSASQPQHLDGYFPGGCAEHRAEQQLADLRESLK